MGRGPKRSDDETAGARGRIPVSKEKPGFEGGGRYALEGLDRAIHEKARLGILTSLAAHPEGLPFTELKELCALTDGNLNRHLHVLDEAGLVEVSKGHSGRRPQTLVWLTTSGRRQFVEYLTVLEGVVSEALEASQAAAIARVRGRPSLATS